MIDYLSHAKRIIFFTLFIFHTQVNAGGISHFTFRDVKGPSTNGRVLLNEPEIWLNQDASRALIEYPFQVVEYWDISKGTPKKLSSWSSRGQDKIFATALSKATGHIALGYELENRVKVISPNGQTEIMNYTWASKSDKREIRALSFSEDGKLLAALSYHGEGIVLDLEKKSEIARFDISNFSTLAGFSQDGRQLYAGSRGAGLIKVQVLSRRHEQVQLLRDRGYDDSAPGTPIMAEGNNLMLGFRAGNSYPVNERWHGRFVVLSRATGLELFDVPNRFKIGSVNYSLSGKLRLIPGQDKFYGLVQNLAGGFPQVAIWGRRSELPIVISAAVTEHPASITASNSNILIGTNQGNILFIDIQRGKIVSMIEYAKLSRGDRDFALQPRNRFLDESCITLLTTSDGEGVMAGFRNGRVVKISIE